MARNPQATLLPREFLTQTSAVDHADWNYRPVLGWLQRRRFTLLLELMTHRHYGRLLEVGYGSGVLMPTLAQRCDLLFGVDPHPRNEEIAGILRSQGVIAALFSASATSLPFDDESFDVVVSVSALEYVEDIEQACREMRRVLRIGGRLIVVTPGSSTLLDLALRVLTGQSAQANYGGRRQRLLPTLAASFRLCATKTFPEPLAGILPVYHAVALEKC